MANFDPFKITIGNLLDQQTTKFPDNEVLVHVEEEKRYTYSELHEACNEMAGCLMALGIEKGDHVGVWVSNHPEWVIIQFAVAKIGAVLVPINPSYRAQGIQYILKNSDVTTLVMSSNHRYFDILNHLVPELDSSQEGQLHSEAFPKLRNVIVFGPQQRPGCYWWDELPLLAQLISEEDVTERQASCHHDDVVVIKYTSGFDGCLKGAMLTHANVVGTAHAVTNGMKLTHEDRLCLPIPFYLPFGSVSGILGCVTQGAAIVIPSSYYRSIHVLQAIEDEACTAVYGIPSMFAEQPGEEMFSSFNLALLQTGMISSDACSVGFMEVIAEKINATNMTIGYGQTESGGIITQIPLETASKLDFDTVGNALSHIETKVINPQTGDIVSSGEKGELCVRSPSVMKGYYNMSAETDKVIDDEGWLRTGDKVIIYEEGYVRFLESYHDVVVCEGKHVYPREVETYLLTHPAIAEVWVVGVPDLQHDNELVAWVKLEEGRSATTEDIRSFCNERICYVI